MQLVMTLAALSLWSPAQETQEAPADSGAVRTAWYDFRPLLSASPTPWDGVDLRVHVAAIDLHEIDPERYGLDVGVDAAVSMEELKTSIGWALGWGPDEASERLLEFRGRLRLVGDDASHAVLADVAAAASAVAMDAALVEVYALDGTLDLPPIVRSARWEKLQGAGRATLRHSAEIPFGRTVTIGGEVHAAHVSELWVEFTRWELFLEDAISIQNSGTKVGLRLDRAVGGEDVLLRAFGRSGEPIDPDRKVQVAPYQDYELTLPSGRSSLFAGSSRLKPGDAMVARCGQGPGATFAIRVLPMSSPMDSAGPGNRSIFHLGEHVAARMRVAAPIALPSAPIDESDDEWTGLLLGESASLFREAPEADAPPTPADDLAYEVLELLRRGRPLIAYGTTVIVPGAGAPSLPGTAPAPKAFRNQLRDALTAYDSTQHRRTVAVEFAYGVLPAEEADALGPDPQGQTERLAAWADRPDWKRTRGSALEGDMLLAVNGTGHRHLREYGQHENEAGFAAATPLTGCVFEGFGVACVPTVETQGSARLHLEALYLGPVSFQRVDKAKLGGNGKRAQGDEPAEPWSLGPAVIEVATGARARSLWSSSTKNGQWVLAAKEPLRGADGTFYLLVRTEVL